MLEELERDLLAEVVELVAGGGEVDRDLARGRRRVAPDEEQSPRLGSLGEERRGGGVELRLLQGRDAALTGAETRRHAGLDALLIAPAELQRRAVTSPRVTESITSA